MNDWGCQLKLKKAPSPQRGGVILGVFMLVLGLTVLGLTLQIFLRNTLKTHWSMLSSNNQLYNIPVNDAFLQARCMAEFGMNEIIWHANNLSVDPGSATLPIPGGGVGGPTAPPPTPVPPTPTYTPGYSDPDYHLFPDPLATPWPLGTPSSTDYFKSYLVESPAPNQLKATGYAYIEGSTGSGATRTLVRRVVTANWKKDTTAPATAAQPRYYLTRVSWVDEP